MALVLDGSNDTITGLLINSANIVDGSIVNADINASAAIASTKLSGISSGKFSSYAVINHSVAYDQGAGTFTNGAWRTRELNTEVTDEDNIVSISSNQFTLQAGTYLIKAQSPAYRVDQHVIRLYNVTDSSVDGVGMAVMTSSSFASQTVSTLVNRITISGAKAFEIQHQCQTSHSTYGLGLHHGISGANSIYTIVEIYKES